MNLLKLKLDKGPGNSRLIYKQIEAAILEQIASGTLRAGDRLPSVREFATALGINAITVSRAYRELAQRNLISGRGRGGTVVAEARTPANDPHMGMASPRDRALAATTGDRDALRATTAGNRSFQRMASASDEAGVLSLTKAYPSAEILWPDGLRDLLDATNRRGFDWLLGYSSSGGRDELREAFAGFLGAHGVACSASEIIPTSGTQQGLDTVARSILQDGDVVLTERPTYFGMLDLARSMRVRMQGVALEADGVSLAELEAAIDRYRPRAFYTMPNFHNPTGISMSAEKRARVVALCAAAEVAIIEDDYAPELRFSGTPLPTLWQIAREGQQGAVFYLRTLSKTYLPGLRIGCIVAPQSYRGRLLATRGLSDLHQSNLVQALAITYLDSGAWRGAARILIDHYAAKQSVLLDGLARSMPAGTVVHRPEGGLNLWVTLPAGIDAGSMLLYAMANRVTYFAGDVFYPDHANENTLRLSFGAGSDEDLMEATARLGKSIRDNLDFSGPAMSIV